MVTVYVVWGSTYLAIRFAIETMPPFLMASFRFLVAGLILYGWRRLAGDPAPARIEWRSAAVVGLLLLAGGNGGVTWAEQYVPSGIAALMVGAAPLWMVVLDTFWPGRRGPDGRRIRRKRPAPLVWAGVLMGFGGIALLVGPAELTGAATRIHTGGAAVLTLAAFLWAGGSLFSRRAPLPDSPLLGTGMEMLVGSLGLLVLGTLTGEWSSLHLAGISVRSLLGLGYLIVFGALVGFAAYTWLLRVAPTPLVSTYAYVNPLVAIFLGSLLANEPVTLRILVSTAIILGSVALITANQPLGAKNGNVKGAATSPGDD
jgi:drug/metabolite transporter (DMT)-like permease